MVFNKETLKYLVSYVMFTVGAIGFTCEGLRPIMLAITPYVLFGLGIYVLIIADVFTNRRLLLWLGGTYLATFMLEVIGVKTGMLFGPYRYGSVLGLKLFEVPVIIGFNWVVVIMGCLVFCGSLFKNIWLAALSVGGLATLFDFVLEPVAIHFDFWTWDSVTVPLQNYGAWYVIAFCAGFAFFRLGLAVPRRALAHYWVSQVLFFLYIRIILI